MTRTERRRRLDARECYVCGAAIVERGGVWHGRLDIIVHQGACEAAVEAAAIDYSRSARGRMRTAAAHLRHIPQGDPVSSAIRSRVAEIRSRGAA
jgi:hypothetical protein